MKAQLHFVALLLVSTLSWAQAPTDGLVAYYPFNAPNATDASGNNRNGTFSGGVSATTDRFGNANQAYNFDGSTGNITVANWQILTGNAARTISVWFKTTLPSSPQYMVSWGFLGTNQSSNLGTYTDGANSTKQLGFFPTDVNAIALTDAFQYYDSRWHLITFTHDGSTMRLYLDGALQNTINNVTLNTASSILAMGRFTTGPFYFSGSLDEVRIYNRALTSTEIQQMYNAEAPPPPSAEFAKIGSNRFIHTVGQYNTSVGNMAGNALTPSAGNSNTFVGYRAGYLTTTGSSNVFLGANANPVGASLATLQNSVALGANAKVAISNAIILGDTANTSIKVGIGTAAPQYTLDVKGSIKIRSGNSGLGQLLFGAHTFLHRDEQDFLVLTGGNNGESGLRFANLNNQFLPMRESQNVLSVDEQGRIGLYQIGLNASQLQLQVANTSQWADHVFNPDYRLRSISEMQAYIKANHYLPQIPSAQEMVDKGRNVEQLIVDLVKTQEEQALYIIQLKEENERLRAESNHLCEEVKHIKALIEQLLKK